MFVFLLGTLCYTLLIQCGQAAKCTAKSGDISARWQVADGELTVEVTTNNIGNNEWSAVGFGPDMSDLSVVIFQVVDFKPSLATGTTQGYGAPTLDSTPSVTLQSLNYNSNTLVARFARPVGSLSTCQTWNFFNAQPLSGRSVSSLGSPQIQVTDVCPNQCTGIFTQRDVAVDPVPQAAIYNNRISNRFDALFDPSISSRKRRYANLLVFH
ncbi:unnamed protein product [Caenorhabditis brenneri]